MCRAELAPFSEETMLVVTYDYASCVRHSEKVAWKVDDVLPADTRLDFSRRFLPDRLSGSGRIHCLSESDRLMLNHINGNSYINLFAFVEEYIVATVVNHAQAEMFGDHSPIHQDTGHPARRDGELRRAEFPPFDMAQGRRQTRGHAESHGGCSDRVELHSLALINEPAE